MNIYKKIGSIATGSALAVLGLLVTLGGEANMVYAQVAPVVVCDSGTNLSYDQAVVSIAHGELVVVQTPDLLTNHVTMVITNNTPCGVPASLASYKMFGPFSLTNVSGQEFVDGTALVTILPSTTVTLTVNIPACSTQYDLFYGAAPVVQTDNQPYGVFLAGNHLRIDQFCVHPPATLHVIKLVVNGNGGTAIASSFNVHVRNAGVDVAGSPAAGITAPGNTYTLAAGTYVVSEDSNALYVQTFTGNCDSGGIVTLAAGEDKICTIVNTDIPLPTVPPVSFSAFGGGGGGSGLIVPTIGILKVPAPLALPGGSGTVTYNYTVWNVGGQIALTNVTVTDDKCSPVVLLSGDLDGDSKLDPAEVWKYSCTSSLSNTTTNTSVATGFSDDASRQAAIATAIATVVVGTVPGLPNTGLNSAGILPPLINILKIPSRLTPFPTGGGNVTYTFIVTNPGVVPLDGVYVVDDKCGPVTRISGDTNGNNLLEAGESWSYTCTSNVTTSTRNVATAVGRANGFIALGYAFATVLVSGTPGFPNTGLAPLAGNGPAWTTLMSLLFIFISLSLIVTLRKRTV